VTSSSTHLANVVTLESRRGSASCPWLFRVSHGQAVNITLIDFTVQQDKTTTQHSGEVQLPTCTVYAEMYIAAAAEPTIICSRSQRQRVLYTSTGRQDIRISIRSDRSSQQNFYFLLRVEGKHLAGTVIDSYCCVICCCCCRRRRRRCYYKCYKNKNNKNYRYYYRHHYISYFI